MNRFPNNHKHELQRLWQALKAINHFLCVPLWNSFFKIQDKRTKKQGLSAKYRVQSTKKKGFAVFAKALKALR